MEEQTLSEIILEAIQDTPDDIAERFLFVQKPWTKESKSEWVPLTDSGSVDREKLPYNMSKFLIGYELDQCLHDISNSPRELSHDEIVEAAIFYAEHNFYPENIDLDFG